MRESENNDVVKGQVYDMIQKAVALKTGRRLDRPTAKAIFDASIEMIFTAAAQTGYMRLPRGFGSFNLRELKPTRLRTPQGTMMDIKESRHTLKYTEGLAIREMLGKLDKHPGRVKPRRSAVSELFEHIEGELTA